ncbi:hypothetical protein [Actinotalea fermentans]|uniref:DUF8094 domain-containing protein n=1 Tax=Actinotalea fermentans TaxID=43671 RepID=A0A511YT69_9CELL|nr:hypothetical protein [Actinotalea fermentans]KGM16031.1 hypothetical protein N867_03665 [Actinotalea fermentans ATCC 43279 = JCM 9966 = DSM 3133]GEN78390.1 hypothetical protein AFE02nite_01240 [Actinotalea fermentans]
MRRLRAAVAVLSLGVLAACSTPLPVPQPDAEPAATPPALFQQQADDVLADVSATLAEADAAVDAALLDPRVTGPAREIRGVEYVLSAAGDPDAVTPIPEGAQTLVLPTTDEWPRTFMAVTESPDDLQAPLLLVLVQENPRAQYRLWSWSRLFPGITMPATTEPGIGSAPVAPDSADLAVAPTDVVAQYVDLLTKGDQSEFAAAFTPDPMRSAIVQTRDAFVGVVGANGSFAETYTPDAAGVTAIATADGGAIVVGTIRTVTTITLADSTMRIGDQTAALLGRDTITANLEIQWLSVVAFRVPPAGSGDPIEVLGAEHSRVQATGQ